MADDLKQSKKIINERYNFFKNLKKPSDLDVDITMGHNLITNQVRALGDVILKHKILNRDQAQILVNYVKFLKELRKYEDDYLKSLTTEQRKAIVDAKESITES